MPHPEGERLIGSLLRIPSQAVVDHISAQLIQRFPGLRKAHMPVIQHIDHPPSGSRLTELAEAAQMTKQSMGELVDTLEREGYLERVADPTDRRAKLIRLTERGWDVHESASTIGLRLQEDWARQLGQDKMGQLLQLLRELIESLDHQSTHSDVIPSGDGAGHTSHRS
jgi:DNA-binding MarR family transcriptional regulator